MEKVYLVLKEHYPELKAGFFNLLDLFSISMTTLYVTFNSVFIAVVGNEILQTVGLWLTVVYLLLRVIYWGRKAFGKLDEKDS